MAGVFCTTEMKVWSAPGLVPGHGLKSHATLHRSCGPEASLLCGQPVPQGRELTPELTEWTLGPCSCPLPSPGHALTSTHPFFHPSSAPSPSTSSATPCLSVFTLYPLTTQTITVHLSVHSLILSSTAFTCHPS